MLKSIFFTGYLAGLYSAIGFLVWQMTQTFGLDQVFALLALLVWGQFFIGLLVVKRARTDAVLAKESLASWVFTVLALLSTDYDQRTTPFLLALCFSILFAQMYLRWYSKFDSRKQSPLRLGHTIPPATLLDVDGIEVTTRELSQHKALWLVYRGNWCPLCMAQIAEVAALYQQFEQQGCKLYMISAQSHAHTQALAKRFNVPMAFYQDSHFEFADAIAARANAGTPLFFAALGHRFDTLMPTVIISDAQGNIRYLDQTDNYRVRPEPEVFLQILAKLNS